MYNYKLIEKQLQTKYIGRIFLQYESLESILDKGKKISPRCPRGILILSESEEEEDNYIQENPGRYSQKILMGILLKLNKDQFEKENIETLAACIGIASILEVSKDYFSNMIYYWLKTIKGKDLLVELDTYKSLKTGDNSLILQARIYYNNELKRENFISSILNNFENYFELFHNKDDLGETIEICNNYLNNKEGHIKINKKNRKTIKKINNIRVDNDGNLLGDNNSKPMIINWEDYEISW